MSTEHSVNDNITVYETAEEAIYARARRVFNSYAAVDTNDPTKLPANPLSSLQARLAAWQVRCFGAQGSERQLLGVVEEVGEALEAFLGLTVAAGRLCHVVLKSSQKIRGYDDPEKARRAVADGISDCSVFLIQLATSFRLDYGELLFGTAEHVMAKRSWDKNKVDGSAP